MKNYKITENYFDGSIKIVLTKEPINDKTIFITYKQALNQARKGLNDEMLWAN